MNLLKKKELAAHTFKVGKNRIYFDPEKLSEIKEAITKQDILAMYEEGIIKIKPVKGRKTIVRRKTRRGPGKIKMKVKHRKQDYVKITRKLRRYLAGLKLSKKISREDYLDLRKKIRMKSFKNSNNFKEHIKTMEANKLLNKGVNESKIKKNKGRKN